MKDAIKIGYKVYLYFVSTASPDINKYRVASRVLNGGHNVPAHLIESRYYRSLELIYEAAQNTYQCYFFDNSYEGERFKTIAHFKMQNGKKEWDEFDINQTSDWFIKYYLNKSL